MNTRPVLYVLMMLVVLTSAVLLFLGIRHQSGVPSPGESPGVAASSANETASPRAHDSSFTVFDETRPAGEAQTNANIPASLRLPEDIRLADVAETKTVGAQTVLVFRDGSELPLSPEVQSRLPNDVRLRLTYKREEP